MLSTASRRLGRFAALVGARAASTTADSAVNVLFVDHEGNRFPAVGREGQTLLDVARDHGRGIEGACDGSGAVVSAYRSSTWTEDLFGEGPVCTYCHVIIAPDFAGKVPDPIAKEAALIDSLDDDERTSHSRLGCQIVLTKALDGIVVQVPDGPPADY